MRLSLLNKKAKWAIDWAAALFTMTVAVSVASILMK